MDVLLSELDSCEHFTFVSNFDKLCVVNCVPGAGKSTLIRSILEKDSRFVAYTFGVADPKSFGDRRIRSACDYVESKKLTIVDEYTEGDYKKLNPCCVFGDPVQSKSEGLPPNYICLKTKRFGSSTCELLNSLGFKISSDKTDKVIKGDPFADEIEGQLIVVGREAEKLAKSHRADFVNFKNCRGSTFKTVTVLTSENFIKEEERSEFYVALTRHTDILKILCPDAIFGPTGQL